MKILFVRLHHFLYINESNMQILTPEHLKTYCLSRKTYSQEVNDLLRLHTDPHKPVEESDKGLKKTQLTSTKSIAAAGPKDPKTSLFFALSFSLIHVSSSIQLPRQHGTKLLREARPHQPQSGRSEWNGLSPWCSCCRLQW